MCAETLSDDLGRRSRSLRVSSKVRGSLCLDGVVRSIGDQLAIRAVDGGQRALKLRGRVVLRLKGAYRAVDQSLENRYVSGLRFADAKGHGNAMQWRLRADSSIAPQACFSGREMD